MINWKYLAIPAVLYALGKKGIKQPKKEPVTLPYGQYAPVLKWQNEVLKQWISIIPLFSIEDFLSIIATETFGNFKAVGLDGERGLMQVSPGTFEAIRNDGLVNFDFEEMSIYPEYGIIAGIRHLYYQIYPILGNSQYPSNDLERCIKAYNCGVSCVLKHDIYGVPITTKEYWDKFLKHKGAILNYTGIVEQ